MRRVIGKHMVNMRIHVVWSTCFSEYLPTCIQIDRQALSFNILLMYCIAVFHRLYPHTIYMPNSDYPDYIVIFIILRDDVCGPICYPSLASTASSQWWVLLLGPRTWKNESKKVKKPTKKTTSMIAIRKMPLPVYKRCLKTNQSSACYNFNSDLNRLSC